MHTSLFATYMTERFKYCVLNTSNKMKSLEQIALTGFFLIGATAGTAKSQTISGTVMNYDDGNPVSGIEVYLDSVIQDTTNAQGTFGFPVSIVRDDSPVEGIQSQAVPEPLQPEYHPRVYRPV